MLTCRVLLALIAAYWCNINFSVFYDAKIEDVIYFLKKIDFDIVLKRIMLKRGRFLKNKYNHIIAMYLFNNYPETKNPL